MIGKEIYLADSTQDEDLPPIKVIVKAVDYNKNDILVQVVGIDYSYWFPYGKTELAFTKEKNDMKLFETERDTNKSDSDSMIGFPPLNLNVLNAPTAKHNVEKKFLEYLRRVQNADTVEEVRAIIFEMKYGATMQEWMGMTIDALPVNPQFTSGASNKPEPPGI